MRNLLLKINVVFLLILLSSHVLVQAQELSVIQINNPDPYYSTLSCSDGINGHIYVGGRYGTFLKYDGSNWQVVANPVSGSDDFMGLDIVSSNSIWAIATLGSSSGAFYHYDGSVWQQIASYGELFFDIFAFNDNEIYLSGTSNFFWKYDGVNLVAMNYNSIYGSCVLRKMVKSGPNTMLLIASYFDSGMSELVEYNRSTGSFTSLATQNNVTFMGIASNDENIFYISSMQGLYKFNKSSGQLMLENGGVFVSTYAKPLNKVFAAWENISYYNGVSWEIISDAYGIKSFFSFAGSNTTYAFGNDGQMYEIVLPEGVAEKEKTTQEFSLYPNPAKDMVKIFGVENNSQVELYDLTGKIVFSETMNEGELNISLFQPGIYFVRVNSGGKMISQKLVIK